MDAVGGQFLCIMVLHHVVSGFTELQVNFKVLFMFGAQI